MTATATKQAEPELKCPRCGARLAERQDWCLECGAAATTQVLPPPGWGLPAVIVGFAVLLAGAAFAVTVTVLSRDSKRSAQRTVIAPTPTQAAKPKTATAPATSSTTASQPTTTPSTSPPPTAPTSNAISPWPAGKQGWTVVVRQVKDRAAAVARAKQLSKQGVDTGLLRSSDYPGLDQGFWMVYSGRFSSQAKAQAASTKLKKKVPTNYVTHVGRRR